ncbi:NTP transferase domain-containing protein [Novipirellula artificiosorum]|uniref:MobA-like NTP transferase domain protein n=1 Tax=Novipirellula artificiosorum TaxID=2528016 RepID=A0A5C6DTL8_9BACT|nr:NTP transferase domain-containing protein [Novipirellula artificiosorum]TWU40673.1 MobA-like NTP transferase domain protein [Novipirellula artificiosorum]
MPKQLTAVAVIDLGDFAQPAAQATLARFSQRSLAGQPLVLRMARRLSECQLVDQVMVVGSNMPSEVLTSGIAGIGGVAGIGSLNLGSCHVCERLSAAADHCHADWVLRVPCNQPFVDPVLVDQLLAKAFAADHCDYLGYASSTGDAGCVDRLGLVGEACHADALRRLRRNADRLPADDSASIASWLENSPGVYQLKFVPLPSQLDRKDLRFAVQDELDWDDAELLCDTVINDDSAWQRLAEIVTSNESLRSSMESRNTEDPS